MEELLITREDLTDLEKWINELPTKYGVPLINFLNSAKQKQAAKADEKKETELSKAE